MARHSSVHPVKVWEDEFFDPDDYPAQTVRLYRDYGAHVERFHMHETAINCLDVANLYNCDDVETLILRSQAKSHLQELDGSFEDSTRALEVAPENLKALNRNIWVDYEFNDFEKALRRFHQACRIRTQPPCFSTGRAVCEETVEDTIGRNAGPLSILRDEAVLRNMDVSSRRRADSVRYSDPLAEYTSRKMRLHYAHMRRVTRELFLGRLAHDLNYLERMLETPGLICPNKRANRRLLYNINQALTLLNTTQDRIQASMPYYTHKNKRRPMSNAQRRRYMQEQSTRRRVIMNTIKFLTASLQEACMGESPAELYNKSEQTKEYLDRQNERDLPEKEAILANVYEMIGSGYLRFAKPKDNMTEEGRAHFIDILFNPGVSEDPNKTKFEPFIDNKKRVKKNEERLEGATTTLERAWVNFDMAYVLTAMRETEQARKYSRRALRAAKKAASAVWTVNAALLVARIEMHHYNKTDALRFLESAMDDAEVLGDESLTVFMRQCVDKILSIEYHVDTTTAIDVREKTILSLMRDDEDLRLETAVLFKRMAVMPPSKCLSLLPGLMARPKTRREIIPNERQTAVPKRSPTCF